MRTLLPCPFCGGEASDTGVIRYCASSARDIGDGKQREYFFCSCTRCGMSNQGLTGHRTRERAIEHWNRRGGEPGLVVAAIAAHRSAVEADEALFNEDGDLLVSPSEADASQAACNAAFRALLAQPCASIADVRAKVSYILTENVGERGPVLWDLTGFDAGAGDTYADDGNMKTFLRSLSPLQDGRV